MRDLQKFALLLPSFISALAYGQSAAYQFVYDDLFILYSNPDFRDWSLVWQALTEPFLNTSYFRPLPLLSFALEQTLSGGLAQASHVVNIGLHGANTLLVTLLAVKIGARTMPGVGAAPYTGLLAGTVYALHPALIESVAWISGRFDLMVTLFLASALLCDLGTQSRAKRVLGVSMLFFLAALCKEMAVSLALVFPLWHLLLESDRRLGRALLGRYYRSGHFHVYAGIVVAGFVYLALRHYLTGSVYARIELLEVSAAQRPALVLMALGRYLMLAFWPFTTIQPLHLLVQPIRIISFETVLGFSVLLLLICSLRLRRPWSAVAILTACFIVALLPVLQILPLSIGMNFVNDRFLQFPLLFFSIAAALALRVLVAGEGLAFVRKAGAALACSTWLTLSGLILSVTLPLWRNELSLWTYAYSEEPNSPIASENLMAAYIDAGYPEKALALAEAVRERQGGQFWPGQQVNYAYLLATLKGEAEEALRYLQGVQPPAIRGDRLNAYAYLNVRGVAYSRMGDLQRARLDFEEALRWRPRGPEALLALGTIMLAQGDAAQGTELVNRAIAYAHPDVAAAWRESLASRVDELRSLAAKRQAEISLQSLPGSDGPASRAPRPAEGFT